MLFFQLLHWFAFRAFDAFESWPLCITFSAWKFVLPVRQLQAVATKLQVPFNSKNENSLVCSCEGLACHVSQMLWQCRSIRVLGGMPALTKGTEAPTSPIVGWSPCCTNSARLWERQPKEYADAVLMLCSTLSPMTKSSSYPCSGIRLTPVRVDWACELRHPFTKG